MLIWIFATFVAFLVIWTVFWKGLGLWYSARNGHKGWFIVMLIISSAGIIPIIYLGFRTDFFGGKKTKPKRKAKKKTGRKK